MRQEAMEWGCSSLGCFLVVCFGYASGCIMHQGLHGVTCATCGKDMYMSC